jgi:hypothetical protein
MALTMDNIKEVALALIDSSTDDPFFSLTSTTLANQANRDVYKAILQHCPEYVETAVSFAYPADTESITFISGSYVGADPYKWVSVERTPSSGSVSSSNVPTPIRPVSLQERLTKVNLDPNVYGYYYTVSGDKLYITPTPTQAINLKIHYIPQCTGMTVGTDVVLAGLAEPFGDAVAYRLAVLLDAKQGKQGRNSPRELWAEALEDISTSGSSRTLGPRFIRRY